MKIRKAIKKDIKKIIPLYVELLEHNIRFSKYLPNEIPKINKKELETGLKNRIKNTKNKPFLIAEKNNKICGFIQAEIIPNKQSKTNKKVIEIIDIYSKYKRKGIGKKLLLEIEKWGKEVKANFILWEFVSGNSLAEKFCIKNNFRPFKTKMLKKI